MVQGPKGSQRGGSLRGCLGWICCGVEVKTIQHPEAEADRGNTKGMPICAIMFGGRCSKAEFLHCVPTTIADSHTGLRRRDLPSLARRRLGIVTPNEKIAKYGKYLSHLKTSSPWVGRLHALRTQCRNLP